jgi:hypothetical protein
MSLYTLFLYTFLPWIYWHRQIVFEVDTWDRRTHLPGRIGNWESAVLNPDGSIVVGNRRFRCGEAMRDVTLGAAILNRPAWSNTIEIRSGHDVLGLRYTRVGRWVIWDRLVPRGTSPPGLHSVRPSLLTKGVILIPFYILYAIYFCHSLLPRYQWGEPKRPAKQPDLLVPPVVRQICYGCGRKTSSPGRCSHCERPATPRPF